MQQPWIHDVLGATSNDVYNPCDVLPTRAWVPAGRDATSRSPRALCMPSVMTPYSIIKTFKYPRTAAIGAVRIRVEGLAGSRIHSSGPGRRVHKDTNDMRRRKRMLVPGAAIRRRGEVVKVHVECQRLCRRINEGNDRESECATTNGTTSATFTIQDMASPRAHSASEMATPSVWRAR